MSNIDEIVNKLTFRNTDLRDNYFKSKFGKGNGPKADPAGNTTFSLNSYNWYPELQQFNTDVFQADSKELIETTPKVLVYEFQPELMINQFSEMIKSLYAISKNIAEGNVIENLIEFVNGIPNTMQEVAKSQGFVGDIYSAEGSIAFANFVYRSLIGGLYTKNIYELPYLNMETTFIKADGSAGWERKSLADTILNGIQDIGQQFGLGSIDIADRPRYTLNGNGPEGPSIDLEPFYLYNYNIDALIKNLNFLIKFISGPLWLQTFMLVRGSNLYNVYLPGRNVFLYCTLDAEITCCGKMRKLTGTNPAASALITNLVRNTGDSQNALFPDAYKLKCSFRSLAPNNFNMLMGAIDGEFSPGRNGVSATGRSQTSALNQFLAAIAGSSIGNVTGNPSIDVSGIA